MRRSVILAVSSVFLLTCGQQGSEAGQAGTSAAQAGEVFLANNRSLEVVKETPSGLQYLVLREGDGARPAPSNTVRVHYQGNLIDGKKFDSSYDRGQPAEFPLNRVIRGWAEGLQLMRIGSKYRLFVPSELGYGRQGAGRQIGPDEVLIFDVELLDIVK